MKEAEVTTRADDIHERTKRKAQEYIERILLGTDYYFRINPRLNPTVFVSNDILSIIKEAYPQEIYYHDSEPKTICGYEFKIAAGENILYIGYNLM